MEGGIWTKSLDGLLLHLDLLYASSFLFLFLRDVMIKDYVKF